MCNRLSGTQADGRVDTVARVHVFLVACSALPPSKVILIIQYVSRLAAPVFIHLYLSRYAALSLSLSLPPFRSTSLSLALPLSQAHMHAHTLSPFRTPTRPRARARAYAFQKFRFSALLPRSSIFLRREAGARVSL